MLETNLGEFLIWFAVTVFVVSLVVVGGTLLLLVFHKRKTCIHDSECLRSVGGCFMCDEHKCRRKK